MDTYHITFEDGRWVLKLEGENALLRAIENAEWQQSNITFPRALGRNEKVLFVLESQLGQKDGLDYLPMNFGQTWFTTQRILFEGSGFQIQLKTNFI